MSSKVYLSRTSLQEDKETSINKVRKLFNKFNDSNIFEKNDLVAVKLHFGEKGNDGYVRPHYVKAIVDQLKAAETKPFLTDTNTLYVGQRSNSVDHLMIAHAHGFSIDKIGCPVIIADGLVGNNCTRMPVAGNHFSEVQIANDAVHAHSMVVLTHVTGHLAAGMGATIKNLAMGLANRGGKLQQHSHMKPSISPKKCTSCGTCMRWCPTKAISWSDDRKAQIDHSICIGCGECLAVCKYNAVNFTWDKASAMIQEKMAEYAAGALSNKKGKALFMNFLLKVTKSCDCMGTDEPAEIPDIGVMASLDPVALDYATVEILSEAKGEDFFKVLWPEQDVMNQINHAEKIGLGHKDYELVEI